MSDSESTSLRGFCGFSKVPRWKRNIVLSEKIDGTNSSVWIDFVPKAAEDNYLVDALLLNDRARLYGDVESEDDISGDVVPGRLIIRAGARHEFVWPAHDNHGFAAWVWDHASQLAGLGEGVHYGEWWGWKINRGYGLREKRFSLFNVARWREDPGLPSCCNLVPVLYEGEQELPSGESAIDFHMRRLAFAGSQAAPGFKDPEGVVIYHTASRSLFKRTFDDGPKGGEQ